MDMEIQQVPWWNRRSRLERRFFVMTIALLCATVGLAIGLTGVLYKSMSDEKDIGGDSGGGGGGGESNVVRYLFIHVPCTVCTSLEALYHYCCRKLIWYKNQL